MHLQSARLAKKAMAACATDAEKLVCMQVAGVLAQAVVGPARGSSSAWGRGIRPPTSTKNQRRSPTPGDPFVIRRFDRTLCDGQVVAAAIKQVLRVHSIAYGERAGIIHHEVIDTVAVTAGVSPNKDPTLVWKQCHKV